MLGSVLVAVMTLSGCGRAGAGEGRLVITGSSTVAPLVSEIGKRYEARTGVRVDVQTGGSSRGLADARSGLADLGMVSRALRPEEDDLRGFAVARDGIALIVHDSNPVAGLDEDAVRAIFTGAVADWSALGGPELPITVVHKAEGRSTLELFLEHFALDNRAVRPSVVIGDNEQGLKTVAGNPGAVAYVSIGAAEHARGRGVPIRLLPLAGVEASTESLRAGRFPLARELVLVSRGAPGPRARAFLDFARSPAVEDLVRELSFVPPAG